MLVPPNYKHFMLVFCFRPLVPLLQSCKSRPHQASLRWCGFCGNNELHFMVVRHHETNASHVIYAEISGSSFSVWNLYLSALLHESPFWGSEPSFLRLYFTNKASIFIRLSGFSCVTNCLRFQHNILRISSKDILFSVYVHVRSGMDRFLLDSTHPRFQFSQRSSETPDRSMPQ